MIDLAVAGAHRARWRWAISARQQISLSYLEQLFGKLRRHELVESTRGPGGGYSLGRRGGRSRWPTSSSPSTSPIDATGCGGRENCMGGTPAAA